MEGPVAAGAAPATARAGSGRLVPFVVCLFFAWGFATVLIDSLLPKLKGLFALGYAEAMLTQFAFFIAYFIVSIPAGMLLARIGYVRGIVVGLLIMAAGCLAFSPAAALGVYPGFLVALFVMASGITLLQVAANPLISVLGKPEGSHSRLNLAQAFNSLGTTIGPLVGSALILKGGVGALDPKTVAPSVLEAFRKTEAHQVQLPFLGIAAVLVVLAAVFWLLRRSAAAPVAASVETSVSSFRLLRQPRLALGALSIFIYVGAEVSIGSLMVNYLMQGRTLGLAAQTAGQLVALYWAGAMVGRFIGAGVLQKVSAGLALACCAAAAALLACASAASMGMVAAATILAIGLCNSIMFPTIFTLAIEKLGPSTPQGSGILCMAIVGGAIIPPITGIVADHAGLAVCLLVPAACYLWIATYGLLARSGVLDRVRAS